MKRLGIILIVILTLLISLIGCKRNNSMQRGNGDFSISSATVIKGDLKNHVPKMQDFENVNLDAVSYPKEQNTPWDALGNIMMNEKGVNIHLDATYDNTKIELSLDNDDKYKVSYFLKETLLASQTIDKTMNQNPIGLTIVNRDIPKAASSKGFTKIHVIPVEGNGNYALGHIKLYD